MVSYDLGSAVSSLPESKIFLMASREAASVEKPVAVFFTGFNLSSENNTSASCFEELMLNSCPINSYSPF